MEEKEKKSLKKEAHLDCNNFSPTYIASVIFSFVMNNVELLSLMFHPSLESYIYTFTVHKYNISKY